MGLGKQNEAKVNYDGITISLIKNSIREFSRPVEVKLSSDSIQVYYGEEIIFSLFNETGDDEVVVYGDLDDDEATEHYSLT